MRIEMVPIEAIREYERNPRVNDTAVGPVAESIKAFGFKVPVIVDAENVLVAGHTRVKAARQLQMTEVPAVRADDLFVSSLNREFCDPALDAAGKENHRSGQDPSIWRPGWSFVEWLRKTLGCHHARVAPITVGNDKVILSLLRIIPQECKLGSVG